MIYTFTPSPAIDYYVHLDSFKIGRINRVSDYSFAEAGKGINSSEMLSVLGVENVASYFSAGFTGKYIDDALEQFPLIKAVPIPTEGVTRVNIKFVGELDTAINAQGPVITADAKRRLSQLISTLTGDDVFIISGSLPQGFSVEETLEFCREVNRQNAKLVLDVPFLRHEHVNDLEVFLIKPNMEEFAMFTGKNLDESSYRQRAEEVLAQGKVRNILLSLGSKGCYYAGEYGRYSVRVPKVTVYSPVGAGDSTLAAFIGTLCASEDIELALKVGNAAGSARVAYGKNVERQQVMDLISEIELIKE
jgi:1-phosphofructokinase